MPHIPGIFTFLWCALASSAAEVRVAVAARIAEVDMDAAADEEAAAAGTGRRVGRTVDVDVDADGDGDEDEEEAVETTNGAVAVGRAAVAAVMGSSVGVCSIEADAMDSLARHRSSGYVAVTEQMPAKAPATNRVGVSSGRAPSLENSFFSISYEVNWTAEYGMMRTQLMPLPLMYPLNPSSRHMRASELNTPLYGLPPVRGWTCWMILSRSSGLTTVRDAAPAHPPATK